jgi:hypothetical protein
VTDRNANSARFGRANTRAHVGNLGRVSYIYDNCGARVRVPDGRAVRTLKTGGTAGPTAYVLRVWNKNIHRCALRPSQGPEATTP